ncbi:hypothetical protein U9M48_000877 [Paspalum notatum var. saurae]|uniref:Integrase catalytic domain-containing protein n=1 Tax=Paspalum notatum var. saurae TaxID=547442 RepID=A0AAQ3PFA3_PASNO
MSELRHLWPLAKECKKPRRERKEEAHVAKTDGQASQPGLYVATTTTTSCTTAQEVHLNEKLVIPEPMNDDTWVLDTGASNHMTGCKSALAMLDSSVRGSVRFGDGSVVEIVGTGSVMLQTQNQGQKVLSEVYFIPKLKSNIVSLGQLEEGGCKVVLENGYCSVFDAERMLIARAPRVQNRLYLLQAQVTAPVCLMAKIEDQAWLWHARYGHLNFRALRELGMKNMVEEYRGKHGLDLFHADLCGQIRQRTPGERNYFLLIVDDYSRYMWLELLATKDEAFQCFNRVKAMAENEHGGRLKAFRSDRGSEFNSLEFETYCSENGIKHFTTTAYSPQQNGVVERQNRTVVEMARCLLKSKGVPAEFWGEAVKTAVYILNRVDKLADKSMPMVFLGYEAGTKGYRVYEPVAKKLQVCRGVVFEEHRSWNWEEPVQQTQQRAPPPTGGDHDSEGVPQRYRTLRNLLDTTEEIIEYEYSGLCLLAAEEPTSVEEALADESWRLAMEAELQSIRDNKTWEFATLPAGHKAIGLKWVFKVHHMDVKSAFLNGDLSEEVYVQQPPGFVEKYSGSRVLRLSKALYGLRQAPRAWNARLDKELLGLGFVRNPFEHAVYRRGSDQEILLVGVYVDDLIITGPSSREIDVFKEQMKESFSMSDLGLLSYYLGIEVCQTEGSITVCQSAYARKILENAGMGECNMCHTSMESGLKLSKKEDGEPVDATRYRSMIGSLRYLVNSRPDLAYSVGIVSRYMENPKSRHWAAVKQLLRYVAGTINYGCRFKRQSAAECRLVGFSDSDHAGDVNDRKSTGGYVFFFGTSLISWASQKQRVVALSSCEAEYIASATAACQAIWLSRVLTELTGRETPMVKLLVDNKSAIALSRNPVHHDRSKHIDTRFHFIRECVDEGKIDVRHVGTEEQLADILTKALGKVRFVELRQQLGVVNLQRD